MSLDLNVQNNFSSFSIEKYKPAYSNLYKIQIYDSDETTPLSQYALLHATKVILNGESLSLDRNNITKQFALKKSNSYSWADNLTIDWREDENWTVREFHRNWLAKFYDRANDCYISGTTGKKKIFKIFLPKAIITCSGVLPKGIDQLIFQWGSEGNIITHSLTYYVTDWKWETDTSEENQDV